MDRPLLLAQCVVCGERYSKLTIGERMHVCKEVVEHDKQEENAAGVDSVI